MKHLDELPSAVMLWIFLSQAGGTDALPYQWSCSALDTVRNGYFLPGLPYVDDPDGFVANNSIDFLPSATALLYIYPLPSSLNCSGTVSAVRYCYFDDNELGTERPIFTLLTLEQNGVFFNITYLTRVFSTPTAQICTGTSGSQYCCDSYTLRIMDQFHLPASNFAFGIIPASSVLLLGFNQVVNPEYVVEHYRETPSTFETGATIEVGSSVTDRALRLFQFFIVPVAVTDQLATEPVTAGVTADMTTGIQSTTATGITTAAGVTTAARVATVAGVTTAAGVTTTGSIDAEFYRWMCSTLENNHYLLPELTEGGDDLVEFVTSNALSGVVPSLAGAYIYPLPSTLNCNGRVSAVRYCYFDSEFGTEKLIFTLLTLRQNGQNFMITDAIDIHSECTGYYCCNISRLNIMDQFRLPAPNFAFAIVPSSVDVLLIGYNGDIYPQYLVQHYRGQLQVAPIPLEIGSTISVGNITSDEALRVFQFIISTDEGTPRATEGPTRRQTTPETLVHTTGVRGGETSTPNSEGLTTEVQGAVGGSSGGAVVAIAGGVVGGGVAVALVLVVVCVVIVVLKSRTSWKTTTGGDISYPNAIYGSDEQYDVLQRNNAGIPQTDCGPNTYGRLHEPTRVLVNDAYEQIPQDPTYAQVEAGRKTNNTYEVVTPTYESIKKQSEEQTSPKAEKSYQVPGKDEDTLYALLNEILTDSVTRDTVVLADLLGSGQFGTVHRGVWQSATKGKVEVAVKTLKEGSGEEDRVKFLQEAAIMGQFKHPNVVEMYGVVTIGEPVLLVLELLAKGDLRGHILRMRSNEEGQVSVDDHTLLKYCREIASGMAYLSNKAFAHRDLAARNILVSEDDTCKIADFGMSRDLMDESYYVSHGGKIPVKWTAPEALHYKKYSTASDVWSYGIVMYEIWGVGHKPFEDLTNNKVLKLVDTGYRLPPPPGCSRAVYTVMVSCWHPETSKRPDFAAISEQLSPTDSGLLEWTEEDKATHPEANKLGADLIHAQELYKDLQTIYKHEDTK